jgi:hypothetical protein
MSPGFAKITFFCAKKELQKNVLFVYISKVRQKEHFLRKTRCSFSLYIYPNLRQKDHLQENKHNIKTNLQKI